MVGGAKGAGDTLQGVMPQPAPEGAGFDEVAARDTTQAAAQAAAEQAKQQQAAAAAAIQGEAAKAGVAQSAAAKRAAAMQQTNALANNPPFRGTVPLDETGNPQTPSVAGEPDLVPSRSINEIANEPAQASRLVGPNWESIQQPPESLELTSRSSGAMFR